MGIPRIGTSGRPLNLHLLEVFLHISVFLLLLVGITEGLHFLRLLGHRPRLNFAGTKDAVDDGAECKDGSAYVEARSPRSERLLHKETHTAAKHTLSLTADD